MHRAGELRREPTPAEQKLWTHLRRNNMGDGFRRQHAIGRYIVDFVCIKKKLVIELDGSGHLAQEDYDAERTSYLESLGYKVVRFWNSQVNNELEGTLRAIDIALNEG